MEETKGKDTMVIEEDKKKEEIYHVLHPYRPSDHGCQHISISGK